MGKGKILVFGGTGPAGICLLRELLFRNHETIVFARNPAKIPEELTKNPLLEIVQAELTDTAALDTAVSRCTAIISLLGPNTIFNNKPSTYLNFYRAVFDAMRTHSVRRIFAMGTISIPTEGDSFSMSRLMLVGMIRALANSMYSTVTQIGQLFANEAGERIDWTVYRLAGIPGGSDDASWRADREDGEVFEGFIGETGWSLSQKRGALARWLVDAVEDGKDKWIGKMPIVSRYAGSGRRA